MHPFEKSVVWIPCAGEQMIRLHEERVPMVNAFASEHSAMVYADCTVRPEGEDPCGIARAILESIDPPTGRHQKIAGACAGWMWEQDALTRWRGIFLRC